MDDVRRSSSTVSMSGHADCLNNSRVNSCWPNNRRRDLCRSSAGIRDCLVEAQRVPIGPRVRSGRPTASMPAAELCDRPVTVEKVWGRPAIAELRDRLATANGPHEMLRLHEEELTRQLCETAGLRLGLP